MGKWWRKVSYSLSADDLEIGSTVVCKIIATKKDIF